MIEARLRRELEEAFANRAHLYRLLLEELEAEVGPEAAERLLARVLERRATLCRLAGAFDRGLFETAGVGFAAETWRPGRAGCCRIRLTRPGAAAAGP